MQDFKWGEDVLEIEEQVLELRKKGYGYRSIASILKIERDIVRNICKKYDLTGLGQPIDYDIPKPKEVEKKCFNCGKEINIEDRRGRKSRFCSDKCRRKWWYENQNKKDRRETAWYHFNCLYCGKDFKVYGNKNRKFCSVRCASDYRHGDSKEKTGYEKRKELEGGTTQ